MDTALLNWNEVVAIGTGLGFRFAHEETLGAVQYYINGELNAQLKTVSNEYVPILSTAIRT